LDRKYDVDEQAKHSVILDPIFEHDSLRVWKWSGTYPCTRAYVQTVINYIGCWRIGSPTSQLSDVLRVIDEHGMTGQSRGEYLMRYTSGFCRMSLTRS
jgi:hypothetical protein